MNPFPEHRLAISNWRNVACATINIDATTLAYAHDLLAYRITEYDALHVACSKVGQADIFVTTDDRLLKRLQAVGDIKAMLPQDALAFLEDWYEK